MLSFNLYCGLIVSVIGYYNVVSIHGSPTVQVEGSFELTSDPGDVAFVEYLEALGVPEAFREVMSRIKINLEIAKQGDGYKYMIITPLATRETTFKFNEMISDNYIDGRAYKTIFTLEGDSVTQKLIFANNEGTNVYKFSPEGIVATLTSKDKKAIRTYKRL